MKIEITDTKIHTLYACGRDVFLKTINKLLIQIVVDMSHLFTFSFQKCDDRHTKMVPPIIVSGVYLFSPSFRRFSPTAENEFSDGKLDIRYIYIKRLRGEVFNNLLTGRFLLGFRGRVDAKRQKCQDINAERLNLNYYFGRTDAPGRVPTKGANRPSST